MFEVIKTEYGKYITEFQFDYSGTYLDFDIFIINAKIKFYEKGFTIWTSLSDKSLFIEWNDIKGITFTKNKKALVNITTGKGTVTLKREKQETDIGEFKKLLNSMVKNIKIEYVKSDVDNISSLEIKRKEKFYDMQEKRVGNFIRNSGYEDDADIQKYWCDYLKEKLQFPFQAEIIDDSSSLEIGDILKVAAIEGAFDLYGIVVKARKGRREYSFPLCLIQAVEENSDNYQLVDDYNFWFCNR